MFQINVFKKMLMSLSALLISLSYASAQNTFSVKMKLQDSKTGDPVGFATVSLTIKGSDTAERYVLSDSEGIAVITKVKKGT